MVLLPLAFPLPPPALEEGLQMADSAPRRTLPTSLIAGVTGSVVVLMLVSIETMFACCCASLAECRSGYVI